MIKDTSNIEMIAHLLRRGVDMITTYIINARIETMIPEIKYSGTIRNKITIEIIDRLLTIGKWTKIIILQMITTLNHKMEITIRGGRADQTTNREAGGGRQNR